MEERTTSRGRERRACEGVVPFNPQLELYTFVSRVYPAKHRSSPLHRLSKVHPPFLLIIGSPIFAHDSLQFQSIELIDFFFFFFCKIFETIDTTPYKYSSMKVKLTFSFFSRAFLRNCNLFSSKREILYGINNAYKGNVYANPPLRILGQSTKL